VKDKTQPEITFGDVVSVCLDGINRKDLQQTRNFLLEELPGDMEVSEN